MMFPFSPMIMRRRTICFILSALLLSSCALLEPESSYRLVRVKALADPAIRERNPGWEQELRGFIEASSDYFENEFGIRLVTQSTAPWPAHARIRSTIELLARLKEDFPIDNKFGSYDLVIAFTAEPHNRHLRAGRPRVDRIGDCRQGLGNYIVTTVSRRFRYTGVGSELPLDVIALIHELGHIFGAEHTSDPNSIMNENFDYRSDFDMKNHNVILKNKHCHFGRQQPSGQ